MSQHEGFKLRVTADEVLSNFKARLGHHRDALAHLERSPLVLVSKDGEMGKSDIMKLHKHQIRLIEFFVAHIAEGDTYALTINEVQQLTLLQDVMDMETYA